MNSTGLAKTIYLGIGPLIYMGFWLFCASQTKDLAFESLAVFLGTCIGLSVLHLLVSLTTLKIHVKWNVPGIKRNGVYKSHAKFAWAYALIIAFPASVSSVMTISTPPGEWQYVLSFAVMKYFIGWFMGGCFGAIFGYFLIAFLVPVFTVLVKFIVSRDKASRTEDLLVKTSKPF